MPLEEALDIAVQISEGLQEAHDQGVVHRDIKPSNVMLDRRGRVKIMDFGLAAVADRTRLTKSGTTLGTPAYMSPEKAQGQDVDRRTDIWALGVVLYEMLAGKHPFPGEYEQAIVYSIINEAPEPVTALRTGVPTQYDQVVSKALAKDAEERYATVADLLVDLRHLRSAATRSGDTKIASPPPKQMRRTNRKLQFALIVQSVLLLALLGVGLILGPGSGDPHRQPQLLKFAVIPDDVVRTAVISPNARYLAYVTEGSSGPGLWIHDFRSDKPREIEGTAGAASPFWSPDSEFIGFAGGGGLKKVDAETGAIQSLYEFSGMGFFVGGTWSPDGSTIVFSRGAPPRLYEVSSRGGEPSLLVKRQEGDGEWGDVSPHFLPLADGNALLFARGTITGSRVFVLDLDSRTERLVGHGNLPVYAGSGYVLAQTSGMADGIWATPFDLEALEPTGGRFPVAPSSRRPSVADNGSLVYLDGVTTRQRQLAWRDRSGKRLGSVGLPQAGIGAPAISPDGASVVVTAVEDEQRDLWLHDVARPVTTQLTFDLDAEYYPVWSPSGTRIAYSAFHAGGFDLFSVPSAGGDRTELLSTAAVLLYYHYGDSSRDIWSLTMNDAPAPEGIPFLQTDSDERFARFSPDGRFVAYVSNESGRREVYVKPFPSGGDRWQVSVNGGVQPQWRGDGKEIFFVEGDSLVAVEVDSEENFSVGAATTLFRAPELRGGSPAYDVAADGKRFLVVEEIEDDVPVTIRIVQNWVAAFEEK